MASAAQQEIPEEIQADSFQLQATGTDGGSALRQTAAERLALHRSRRAQLARLEAQ